MALDTSLSGKRFTEMASGVATLTAGSVVVSFPSNFSSVPHIQITSVTNGTNPVTIKASGAAIGSFVATSVEYANSLGGSYVPSGVTAVNQFEWLAYLTN